MGAPATDPIVARKVMIEAGVTPLAPFTKNRDRWKSRCNNCRRIVEPSYGNVRNGHSACRYCAKGGLTRDEAHRLLVKYKAQPISDYPGYKLPWKCKCMKCGREISPRTSLVAKTGKPCNYCNKRKVDPTSALIIARKAGAIPLEDYPGAGRWKCECKKCKRVIFPTLRRMRNGQNPCGWCAGVRVDPQEAKQVFLSAGLKPIGKYPGSSKPWASICQNCGARGERSLSTLRAGRYACGFCAGRKMKAIEAKSIMREAGAIPLEPFVGINEKWKSKCSTCFREISPKLANVRAGHSPCVYCSGKKVDHETAHEFALTRGLKPLTKYPGATTPWRVSCLKCERVSKVSWVAMQMKRKNAGCSSCTEHGFKPLEPAYLYLITHKSKNAHKVGIGNKNARRIERHIKNGWTVHRVYEFTKGTTAHRIEQELIEWFRVEKSIGPAFRSGDGWTETVPADQISLTLIHRKMKEFGAFKATSVPTARFKKS